MVIILDAPERRPKTGQLFMQGLMGGAQQGFQSALQNAPEMMKQRQKQEFLSALMNADESSKFGGPSNDPFSLAEQAAIMDEPALSRVLSEKAKTAEKQRFARESAAEPKLQEMEDKLRGIEQSGMRFERLGELFSHELESKFPSSFMAGLFTKEGELSPKAASLLSPEAQEATKLIADELTGIKDSFGARVTNFDIQSYMKRLPGLINNPEGRRRVLRDLQIINEVNRAHTEGVLEIIDRYGGPGTISVSQAERLFKKQYAPQMKAIKEEFVKGGGGTYSTLPDASRHAGRLIQDKDTGQKLRSNGKEWIPE